MLVITNEKSESDLATRENIDFVVAPFPLRTFE